MLQGLGRLGMFRVELHSWHVNKFLQAIAGKALILCAVICIAAIVPATHAHANTQQCKALNRQLVSLPRGNSANYRKYDNAAKRQAAELAKTKRLQSSANCNFLSGGKCSALRNSVRRMESNYRKLISTRNRFGNTGSSKRISIQRKIAALRCGTTSKIVKKNTPKKRNTIIVRGGESLRPSFTTVPQMGNFRTMCVRTCDGYYFPVSHASTNGQLSRDESICKALCPAAESRLYFHRNSDQETEDMVSLRGEPYTALPTAFKYRTQERDPYCTCGKANPQSVGLALPEAKRLAEITPAKPKQDDFLASLPAPALRPNLFADAETQADEASGLTRETIMRFVGQESGEMQVSSSTRKVRVVGPEFLPDPSTAIDLQAPAPTLVQ